MTVGPIIDTESLNLLLTVTDRETGQPKSLVGAIVDAATKSPGGTLIRADYVFVYGDPANGQIQAFWPSGIFYGYAGTHDIQVTVQDGPQVGTVYNEILDVTCSVGATPPTIPEKPYSVPDADTFADSVWTGTLDAGSTVPVGAVDSVAVRVPDFGGVGILDAVARSPGGTINVADSAFWTGADANATWAASAFYDTPGTQTVQVSVVDGVESDAVQFNLSVFCSIFPPQTPVEGGAFYLRATERGADTAAINMGVTFPELTFDLAAQETGADRAAIFMTLPPPELTFTLAAQEVGADTAAINMGATFPEITFTLDATETGADTAAITMDVEWPERTFTLAAQEVGADTAAINMGASFPERTFTLDATEVGADTAAIAMDVEWPELTFTLDATETGADTAAINMTVSETLTAYIWIDAMDFVAQLYRDGSTPVTVLSDNGDGTFEFVSTASNPLINFSIGAGGDVTLTHLGADITTVITDNGDGTVLRGPQ